MARSTRLGPKCDTNAEIQVRASALSTQLGWNRESLTSVSHRETLDLDYSLRRVTFVLSIRR